MPSRSQSFVCPGAAPSSPVRGGWPSGYSPGSAEGWTGCPPSWKYLSAARQCSSPSLHAAQLACGVHVM